QGAAAGRRGADRGPGGAVGRRRPGRRPRRSGAGLGRDRGAAQRRQPRQLRPVQADDHHRSGDAPRGGHGRLPRHPGPAAGLGARRSPPRRRRGPVPLRPAPVARHRLVPARAPPLTARRSRPGKPGAVYASGEAVLARLSAAPPADGTPSMDELAAVAGVSRAALYSLFGSRAALLEAIGAEVGPSVAERVLAAAGELVAELGLAGLSLDEAAGRSGVS